MEILTEKQQVEKQARAIYSNYQLMDNELSKMKNKLSNYMGRLFWSETKKRMKMYDIKVHEEITSQLYDYQNSLYKRLAKLNSYEQGGNTGEITGKCI